MLPCAGVRYQVAPSKRSSRACSTPAVSAPASGCPPMKRSSAPRLRDGALGRADVADHAVRGPAAASAARDRVARARRRAPRRTRPRRPRRRSRRLGAPRRSRRARAPARAPSPSGSYPRTLAPARSRAASPIEPPISPTPRTAIRIRSALRRPRPGGAAIADGAGQALEHLDGRLPVDAAVGDRLAVAQLDARRRSWRPATRNDSSITPTIASLPARDLRADLGRHVRLALGVLAAVVVAEVDHQALAAGRRRRAARAPPRRCAAS